MADEKCLNKTKHIFRQRIPLRVEDNSRSVTERAHVRDGKEEMLFDLDNDPAEEKNLATEKPELLRELKEAHKKIAATFLTP